MAENNAPTIRVLSLGAGVQSTALLLLAAEGRLPKLSAAIFADTGWEPADVYEHLDRVEQEVAKPAGIPILRVSGGDIRHDILDGSKRFVTLPLFVRNPDGSLGMGRRQCTGDYKIKPIKAKVRELLDYPHPAPIPAGVYAEQWVGISRDEFHRAKDSDVRYARNHFPLLHLDGSADGRPGWTREDCRRYLTRHGFGETPKSACIGCPFHGNRAWRELRDNRPDEWADAVDFDHAIRNGAARASADGKPLHGQQYLHRSRVPLGQAPIDRVTRHEWGQRQATIWDGIADADAEDGAEDGCSPWSCRSDGAA